jgi:peroxiredoxin (alkyl hydroperoxide reductase subunit C)
MKRLSVLFCSLFLSAQSIGSAVDHHACQCVENSLLIGRAAPGITAKAVAEENIVDFSLQDHLGKYVVLLFYPLDFTFVCPTELHAFQEKLQEFSKRNAQVVGCSVDSPYTHLAWLNTPRDEGGIEGIKYPLISDLDKSVARSYQVLNEQEGTACRALFVIDRSGVIRHQLINDLAIGRSVDEVLRFLDALNTVETIGGTCPANWKSGDKTLEPTDDGLIDYFR